MTLSPSFRIFTSLLRNAASVTVLLPLRMAFYIGVLAAVAGVLVILHVLYCVIAGQAVPGWATMTILISIFGSLNLMGLGIVGEYLGRIFEEAKNRPLYWLQDDTASHADNPYRETHDHL